MAQKGNDKAGEVLASRKNELSVVAQDRNWRSYVANELRCADQWNNDWGFLGAATDGKLSANVLVLAILARSEMVLKSVSTSELFYHLLYRLSE